MYYLYFGNFFKEETFPLPFVYFMFTHLNIFHFLSKLSLGTALYDLVACIWCLFQVHFFNSFFHRQLVTKGYNGVKRWTKKVLSFSYSKFEEGNRPLWVEG